MQRRICLIVIAIHVASTFYAFALAAPPQPTRIISTKANGKYKQYCIDESPSDKKSRTLLTKQPPIRRDILHNLSSILTSTFLPSTPNLKQSHYLSYILYDNLQDLTTSLRSVLATRRILEGVGVGRSDATALSATLNFLIRDGCGMAASLLFTSFTANTFRRNILRWKYFADIMIDIGITLEILAPSVLGRSGGKVYHGWFLPLLCAGNVCKALCGVAAGATSGALQMYWGVKLTGSEDGISEVSAKCGAQRTVVGGVGLVLAGLTAKWLDGGGVRQKQLWIGMYCLLTALHLVFNWMSLKLVALDWLNGWRLHKVVNDFLCSVDASGEWNTVTEVACTNPIEASQAEPILFLPEIRSKKSHSRYPIRLGVSFNELISKSKASLPSLLAETQQSNNRYILKVGHSQRSERNICILISFLSECSNKEKAKAYLHACLVGRALDSVSSKNINTDRILNEGELITKAEQIGKSQTDLLWPVFERSSGKVGWKLEKTEISTEGYEITFE